MGGKSAPEAPDYTAAAIAQAEASRDVTEQGTWANRPDQYTPWGATTWDTKRVYDPTTQQYLNRWSQYTTLDPNLQASLDAQIEQQRARSELANSLTGRIEEEYGSPMNWGALPERAPAPETAPYYYDQAGDALYSRATSRLDPQWERKRDDMTATLTARGLRPDDPAWQRAMNELDMAETDAYQQAQWQATMSSGQEGQRMFGMDLDRAKYMSDLRNQQLAEEMQRRGFSLNEIQAILSGQQVGMPSMPAFSQAGTAQAPDYMGAAQAQYSGALNSFSAEQAGTQGLMAGAAALAPLLISDRRLKKSIRKIGKMFGLNLYEYSYLWGERMTGFMADEVAKLYPDAVFKHNSGYDMIDVVRIIKEA